MACNYLGKDSNIVEQLRIEDPRAQKKSVFSCRMTVVIQK